MVLYNARMHDMACKCVTVPVRSKFRDVGTHIKHAYIAYVKLS